jgi:uncharacterized protein (TIGR02677 family)
MVSVSSKPELPGLDVLWYIVQPLTPTYRAIVEVFAAAEREEFTLELSEPEVLQALLAGPYQAAVDDEAVLRTRLDELHTHGNLSRRQDERAISLEDLLHRRYLWSLTSTGKAAHKAVHDIESAVGQSGSLPVTLLTAIRDSLLTLDREAFTADGVYAELGRLFTTQEQFTEEAQRYISRITDRRMLEVGGLDEKEFRLRKEAVKLYLSRFINQLALLTPEIEEGLRRLDGEPIVALIERGSTSDDIPPADDTGDPAEDWRTQQRTHWQGLTRWYLPVGARPPTVERLRAVALDAVTGLTRALTRLNAARSGVPTRTAAFRQAARWMAEQDAEGAHRLWVALTGLHPARHLSFPETDPEVTSKSTSWWDAAPAEVPVTIRRQNRSNSSGRPSRARDTRAAKQLLKHRNRREREQARAAMAALLTNGPLRLSDFARLERREFDLLLELLSDALCARRTGRIRTAASGASGVEVSLTDPEPDRPRASLKIADGIFHGPDYLVDIRLIGEAGAQASGGAR